MKHGWWAVCMQGPWGSERQLAVQSLLVFRLQGLVHSSRAKEAPLLAPEVLTLMSSLLGSFLLGHGGQRVNGVSLHLKESPESLTGAQPRFHHGVPEGDLHHVTLTGTLDSK